MRAKLYSYKVDQETKSHNKCKGVKSSVVKKEITMDHYRNTLYSRKNHCVNQNNIRSYHHQIYSETSYKVALSCNDDKVYICDNNVHTRNLGHYLNKKSNLEFLGGTHPK